MLQSATPSCLALLVSCTLLAACGAPEQSAEPPERDPAVWQALYDQLLVDPDLATQNEANAALTTGIDHSLPPFDPGDATIRAARAEAVAMTGGEARMRVPQSEAEGNLQSIEDFMLADGAASRCATTYNYSAGWAATMPDAFQVFPRGAVMSAAGAVGEGCALRVVVFLSGNTRDDQAAFYRAQAKGADFDPTYSESGEVAQLTGERGETKFALKFRQLSDGPKPIVETTLMTLGL